MTCDEFVPVPEREAVRDPAHVQLMGENELVVREVPICVEVKSVKDWGYPYLKTTVEVDSHQITQTNIPVEQFAEMQAEQVKQQVKEKLIENARRMRDDT